MLADALILGAVPDVMKAEVGNLEHPTWSYDAIRRLQIAVHSQQTSVQVDHSFEKVMHQWGDEHLVEFDVFIFDNVLTKMKFHYFHPALRRIAI